MRLSQPLRVITVAEAWKVAGISFHVLGEQKLKEYWPNSVFTYRIWRSCWVEEYTVGTGPYGTKEG